MSAFAISNPVTSPALLYGPTKAGVTVAHQSTDTVDKATGAKASVDPQATARSIMALYDLHNITYKEMAALGRELVAAGALPEDKLLDFTPLPSGQIRVDGTFIPLPDSKMDMIALQQDIIASQKAFGLKTDYTTMVLKLFKNFQALHDRA